jgi:hypothetical protein
VSDNCTSTKADKIGSVYKIIFLFSSKCLLIYESEIITPLSLRHCMCVIQNKWHYLIIQSPFKMDFHLKIKKSNKTRSNHNYLFVLFLYSLQTLKYHWEPESRFTLCYPAAGSKSLLLLGSIYMRQQPAGKSIRLHCSSECLLTFCAHALIAL